jgi:hypothetical protein
MGRSTSLSVSKTKIIKFASKNAAAKMTAPRNDMRLPFFTESFCVPGVLAGKDEGSARPASPSALKSFKLIPQKKIFYK